MAALLSAREAADVCKVSERTIRNWISAGKLPAKRTPAGFRVRAEDLPTPSENGAATSGKNGHGAEASAELSDLVALVRELIPKAEAAAMWQARAEFLASQLEHAQLALAAPKADSPEIAPGRDSDALATEPTQTPAKGPQRAPWWMPWRRATS
jgi:excisionase family DNA binding protein